MSIRKTYQALHYQELDTYVSVNGQKTLIKFRGGSLRPKMNGKYSTDDPKVIEALDKAKGNGVSFVCIIVEGEAPKTAPAEKKVKVQEEVVDPTPDAPEKKPDTPSQESDVVEVLEVTNLQEAKEFLVGAVEGLKPSQMPNAKSILNQAAKNKFSFPNLKQ